MSEHPHQDQIDFKQFRDSKGNLCHVIAPIIDERTQLVAYKYWRKHKQRWEYGLVEYGLILHWKSI